MKVYFSRHAKNRMRKFSINKGDVEKVLRENLFIENTIEGRKNMWGRHNNKYLRITYIEEDNRITIITVVSKEKLPKKGVY